MTVDSVPARGRSRTITIKNVASAAGVSVTTVSDVVNGKGRVDPATRAKVMAAVQEVGWRPRRSARALRSGQTGIFALCLPRSGSSVGDWLLNADYDMALVAGCAAAAVDSQHQLLLAPRPEDVADLARLDVDGVIIADPREGDPALSVLNRVGIPVVSIERDLRRTDGWWVQTDSDASTRTMLDHLAQQGAERIALVTIEGPWAWFEDTTAAYDGWCADHGRRPIVRLIDPERPRETAELAMRELLDRRPTPDAVFAVPYGAPQGILDAAGAVGIRVPDDLMVAAGIDSQTLQVTNPPVTALDLRPIQMARAAVDLLARRVAGEYQAGPAHITPDLVIRRSTSPAS